MTLTELTTLLHRWADAHGGKFPEAIVCGLAQYESWERESMERFVLTLNHRFKGVRIITSVETQYVFFASSPNA